MPSTPKCNCNIYKDHIVIHESHCNIQKQSTQPWKEENYHKIEKILNNFKNLKITYSDAIGDIQNIISSERAKLLKEIEEKIKKEVATITEDRLNCIKEILSLLNSIRN